jgi:DNA invertase Pin-like site-specific DNA recombinase
VVNVAVAYARVSTEEQARGGVSLDAQEERLVAYAAAMYLPLARVIREEGVSGAHPIAERPGGHELLATLSRGEAGHVLAVKLDRLFRDAADCLAQTRAWDRVGVSLHLLDLGGATINTASAMGRMFMTMTAGFAELERNLIAERTATALAHKKAHGRVYAPIPYGYDRGDGGTLVANEGEQAVLRGILARRAAGWSYGAIAEDLNRGGIPTKTKMRGGQPTAGVWYPATVRFIAANDLHRR